MEPNSVPAGVFVRSVAWSRGRAAAFAYLTRSHPHDRESFVGMASIGVSGGSNWVLERIKAGEASGGTSQLSYKEKKRRRSRSKTKV